LATSAKSNSAYSAIDDAIALVKSTGDLPVPLHIRNAPTKLMKELGYGKDYKYAHSYEKNFVEQDFLPKEIKNRRLYTPQNNPLEIKILERLKSLWGKRYDK
jgi:putative ATPase